MNTGLSEFKSPAATVYGTGRESSCAMTFAERCGSISQDD